MARWMIALVGVFAVIYAATVVISGTPEYLIPGGIILLLVIGYAVIERLLTKKHMDRHHGDAGEAMADDEDWAIPSAHLIPDDDRPAGDTPEAHNEINPHDLPRDHPGRRAAEAQAGGMGGETTGNREGGQGGRFERTTDETEERTGEPQRSASHAKQAGGGGDRPGAVTPDDEPTYRPS